MVSSGNMSLGTSNNLELGADATIILKSTNDFELESSDGDVTIKSSSSGKIDLNPV